MGSRLLLAAGSDWLPALSAWRHRLPSGFDCLVAFTASRLRRVDGLDTLSALNAYSDSLPALSACRLGLGAAFCVVPTSTYTGFLWLPSALWGGTCVV